MEILSCTDLKSLMDIMDHPKYGRLVQRCLKTNAKHHGLDLSKTMMTLSDKVSELADSDYNDWGDKSKTFVPGLYCILSNDEMGLPSFPSYYFPGQHIIDACRLADISWLARSMFAGIYLEIYLYHDGVPIHYRNDVQESSIANLLGTAYSEGSCLPDVDPDIPDRYPYHIRSLVNSISRRVLPYVTYKLRPLQETKKARWMQKLHQRVEWCAATIIQRCWRRHTNTNTNTDTETSVSFQQSGRRGPVQLWFDRNGELHRSDGPAIITSDSQYWFHHGLPSSRSPSEPTVTFPNGRQIWFHKGVPRQDGPFITSPDVWWDGDICTGHRITEQMAQEQRHKIEQFIRDRMSAILYNPNTNLGRRRIGASCVDLLSTS